jgi:hypothetical protein
MLDAFARCEAGRGGKVLVRARGSPSALAFVVDSLRLIESPARALGAAVVRRFAQMTAVAPVGRRPFRVPRAARNAPGGASAGFRNVSSIRPPL